VYETSGASHFTRVVGDCGPTEMRLTDETVSAVDQMVAARLEPSSSMISLSNAEVSTWVITGHLASLLGNEIADCSL
jgi:hypothetical protein